MMRLPPASLPSLPTLAADLLICDERDLASYLSVPTELAKSWLDAGTVPRAAHLALFWPTRWGRSTLDCDAYNDRALHTAVNLALADENRRLLGMCKTLLRTGQFSAANDAVGLSGFAGPGSIGCADQAPYRVLALPGNDP